MDSYLRCEDFWGFRHTPARRWLFSALTQLNKLVDVAFFLVIADIQTFALRLG